VFGVFRLPDQLVDRFAGKQLAAQVSSPHTPGTERARGFWSQNTLHLDGEKRVPDQTMPVAIRNLFVRVSSGLTLRLAANQLFDLLLL
jgi:hypothetical protein